MLHEKRFPASQAERLENPERLLWLPPADVILDWRTDVEPLAGPPLAHRIAPTDALGEVRSAGFERLTSAEIGQYSWMVQGEKVQ